MRPRSLGRCENLQISITMNYIVLYLSFSIYLSICQSVRPIPLTHARQSVRPSVRIVLYSSIYIAPLNSHRQTEALLVRLAPRKETSFKK